MAVEYSHGKTTASAKLKVIVSGLIGVGVVVLTGSLTSWREGALLGWDAAALVFLVWIWSTVWPLDGQLTSHYAVREDPSRAGADIVVLIATLASLASVLLVLADAGKLQGASQIIQIALGVVSVVVSWTVLHTIYALRYAELYYAGQPGGIDFPGVHNPSYKDFAYLSFTLGMTFQVSDTGFRNSEFRTAALRHTLISYLFGTIIIATTINLIAGLTS